ncbi:MAG: hypothetical protein R2762_11605 [Bryobacteraceae bacterium]
MTSSSHCTFRPEDTALVESIAKRTGAPLPAAVFVEQVQLAFADAQRSMRAEAGSAVSPEFRDCPSFGVFRGALEQARSALAPSRRRGAVSILAVGARPEIPARDSGYAADVTAEVFGSEAQITRMEIGCQDLAQPAGGETYDLVVTHSLPHFFLDMPAFLKLVTARVRAGGGYVMGSEPNRRYWSNAELAAQYRELAASVRRRRTIGSLVNPVQIVRRFFPKRAAGAGTPFPQRVNMLLRERHGLQGDLTAEEMNRISDPFFPHELSSGGGPGGPGLDWEHELPAMMPGFRREWIATTRFLGRLNPNTLAPVWQQAHAKMERQFPLDGSVFSALWWRETPAGPTTSGRTTNGGW